MGCRVLLQGVFLSQGWNPRLLHLLYWQADSLTLSHLGSPQETTPPRMSGMRQYSAPPPPHKSPALG